MAKAKSTTIGEYIVEIAENYSVKVYRIPKSAIAALKDCAAKQNFEVKDTWFAQALGRNLLKEFCNGEKSGTIGEYHIERREDNHINVYQEYKNTIGALREISELIGFKYEDKWDTQHFGRELVKYAEENGPFKIKKAKAKKENDASGKAAVYTDTSITELDIDWNGENEAEKITSLDISKLTDLEHLSCCNNKIQLLDISNAASLSTLFCSDNELTSLTIDNRNRVKKLDCSNNQLTTLDLHLPYIQLLNCSNNKLAQLRTYSYMGLMDLNCADNELTSLEVNNNGELRGLDCSNNVNLKELDLSQNQNLVSVDVSNTAIEVLDLRSATRLETVITEGCKNLKQIFIRAGLDKDILFVKLPSDDSNVEIIEVTPSVDDYDWFDVELKVVDFELTEAEIQKRREKIDLPGCVIVKASNGEEVKNVVTGVGDNADGLIDAIQEIKYLKDDDWFDFTVYYTTKFKLLNSDTEFYDRFSDLGALMEQYLGCDDSKYWWEGDRAALVRVKWLDDNSTDCFAITDDGDYDSECSIDLDEFAKKLDEAEK